MRKQVFIFLLINIIFLIVGFNLKQKNPEELFLSDQNLQSLREYNHQFGDDEITFVTGVSRPLLSKLEEKVSNLNGEWVSIDRLLPQTAVFTLPHELDDESKFDFFSNLKSEHASLNFAGPSFTNAHLAGMSLKIQKVIFPAIFSIMFLCLLFVFRNFTTTAYLFLTSFVGVSVGMAVIKILYSYSTILTSLTPLVSFILTMANQMHVVFGIHTYKSKDEFLKHKLRPILIMMVTTVIGFAGLIYSDLVSVRQFGMATTITLLVTWACNLIFLTNFKLDFHVPKKYLAWKIARPQSKRWLGLSICASLLLLGVWSLKQMPTLVDAIFFFPKDHPVRLGHLEVEKQLGGTPQFEIMISKADQSELSILEMKNLFIFEQFLKAQNSPFKILSLNELILTANKIYSGDATLPEVENAYLMLRGQIPEMLRKSLASKTHYKISLLSSPLSQEQREASILKVGEWLKKLPPGFSGKLTGLNYLLLESQGHLVITLLQSLMGSFLLIAAIFALFSQNLKEIFMFSLISLSSIFGGLWLMYLIGFSLNVSSVMILSISIGLIDDSTIHLLYAQRHGENELEIQNSCILPMMFSNLVLLIGFSILGWEKFIPIKEFAWGLVLMLGMGFLLDLFVLPMFSKKLYT